MEKSSQPQERRGTKRPQSSQSTLLSFVFKKPKEACPEPDDASSEFQAFTFSSNCTCTFDRAWLYSVNPILYFDMFCVCPGYYYSLQVPGLLLFSESIASG